MMQTRVHAWVKGRAARCAGLGLVIGVLLAIAGCGSSDSPSDSTSEGGSGNAGSGEATQTRPAEIDPDYSGPDKRYFTTIPTPERKSGQSFTVGFLEPNGAEVTHDIWIKGAREQVQALGGELIVKDAQLDAAKQATHLNELVAQDVDAIICAPLVTGALRPGLERARAEGIPVVGLASSFDLSQPLAEGYDISIGLGWDYAAYSVAKVLADQAPEAGFAVLGLGSPIPALQYEVKRQQYWASKFGLEFQGQVDAKAPDPGSVSAASATLLSKYPDARVVMTFNDTAAIAAASTAGQKGASDVAFGDALGGNPAIKPAIESGRVAAVYASPWLQVGQQTAVAAYSLLTEQNVPLPKGVNVPSIVLTKENVGSYDFGE